MQFEYQETIKERFLRRVKEVITSAPNYMTAKEILNREFFSVSEQTLEGLPGGNDTQRFNGAILRSAREQNVLSQELNSGFINLMRNELMASLIPKHKLDRGKPFVPTLREIAKEEQEEELEHLFREFGPLQMKWWEVYLSKMNFESDEDKDVSAKYSDLSRKITEVARRAPATFFLHFFDNGDLEWIWRAQENDEFGGLTPPGIAVKSAGMRFGDSDNANW